METGSGSKTNKILPGLNRIKWRIAFKSILTGLVAGLLVVLYRIIIEYGTETAMRLYAYTKRYPLTIVPLIAVVIIAGILIAWLLKLEPMATGSGIPQVEGLLIYGLRIKWYTVLAVRFTAGIISSFFGLSLGREGPSIQIGAAGSQAVAQKISNNKLEENYLITGGAAAGLSAAFNSPLSGIVFALEEVHKSFSGLVLIAATTASITADLISKCFFGMKPVLSFAIIPQLPFSYYAWLVPLGIISGFAGALMSKSLLIFQTVYNKMTSALRPCVALLIAILCGIFIPQVLGGGSNLIKLAEDAGTGIATLLILFVVKFIFTCTSFGSGIPGGIFLPLLSIGAISGSVLGHAAVNFGMPQEYIAAFAVFGMAGALSGSVKAPVTSILLTAEMTGSFVHLLPVTVCSFIALFLSDILKFHPIYESLLARIMEKSGVFLKNEKSGGLIEVPVELGSVVSGRCINEVDWPQNILVVNIRRGENEIIPNGKTMIAPGDYLIVMTSQSSYGEVSKSINELCRND